MEKYKKMAEGHKFIQTAINDAHKTEAAEELHEKWDTELKAIFNFYIR
jgi:hypothetical protein